MADNVSRVVIVPCDSYDEEKVYACLSRGLAQLGGIASFVNADEKVLVKPNFLVPSDEKKAVTTHPNVIAAVLRLLNEYGCSDVLVGDSPGHGSCKAAAEKLGLSDSLTKYGARLSDMSEEVKVDFPDGLTAREFYFSREVTEVNAIINVCKMKTHALERITGAVKNLYGLICGARKAAGHVKFPNASVFARMLADIHRCTKPRLHIMDGIVAMEGNGPGSGDPTAMNVLLISDDPVALDTVFCELVYLAPELVPTNVQGSQMGIGTDDESRIVRILADESNAREVSVDELQGLYGNSSFDVDRKGTKKTLLGRYSSFMTALAKRPVIDAKKCVKCGICVNHCPVTGKAVSFTHGRSKPPVYDYKKCIRCYCCQEMCPKKAIGTGRHLFKRQ